MPSEAGARAYFDMLNAHGGIDGRKIDFITEDNAFDPQQTLQIARKMVSRDHVQAIVTINGTAATEATFRFVLEQSKVPIRDDPAAFATVDDAATKVIEAGGGTADRVVTKGVKAPTYAYAPVATGALVTLAGKNAEGLRAVSLTLPPTSDDPAVAEYRDAMEKYQPKQQPDFYSIANFAWAKAFGEILKTIKGPINSASITKAVESGPPDARTSPVPSSAGCRRCG